MSRKRQHNLPTQPDPVRHSPAEIAVACGLLALAALVAHWRMLSNGFILTDDTAYITENGRVQAGLTWEGARWAFTAFHAANWHPLTWLSHMLDCQLYGLNPWGHHLTSLLLHTASAVLLLLALRLMTGSLWRSAFVAALFALHPLHVESVAWAAERKDQLCAFFWMLTLIAYGWYARRPGWRRYLLTCAGLVMALLSKPMAVTLPFVLLVLDWWPLGRSGTTGALRLAAEKLPLLALCAASSVVTLFAQRSAGAVLSLEQMPLGLRAENAVVSYWAYLAKAVWPAKLAAFYPFPTPSAPAWLAVVAALALVGVTVATVWAGRRRGYLAAGWLWYIGAMVPVIGLVQVSAQAMADRYAYIPLVGIFITVAWGIPDLTGPFIRERTRILGLTAVALVVLMALAAKTWVQTGCWKDGTVLYAHALSVTSDNAVVRSNLGQELLRQHRIPEAVQQLRRAVALKPDWAQGHCNLADALAASRDAPGAVLQYTEAIRLLPDWPQPANNLAWLLATDANPAIRDGAQAVRLAQNADRLLRSQDAATLDTLAAAYAESREFEQAIGAAERAAALAETSRQPALAAQIRERLALYRSAQPYRSQ